MALAILLSPGLIALTAYADAFQCKRRLFGANNGRLHDNDEQESNSIYELENKLFYILGETKLHERAVDLWACAAVLAVWAATLITVLLNSPSSAAGYMFQTILALTIALPLGRLIIAIRQRANAQR
jgi:hypothetical protein